MARTTPTIAVNLGAYMLIEGGKVEERKSSVVEGGSFEG